MDSLIARDLAAVWHPCSQMTDYADFAPVEIVKAEGSYLYTADGRKIFDAISSWWCKAFGHRHPHLQAALQKQCEQFEQVILANTCNELTVRFAERLLACANGYSTDHWGAHAPENGRLPGWFGKVFFADNGSTAVEICLKMALQAQQQRGAGHRTRFMALEGGYHGETVATLAVGDCGLYGEPYRPLMFDVPMITGLPIRSGPNDPLWQDCSAEWPQIEEQLNAHAQECAAIVYEPIMQGAGGMRLYSPDLLRRLRRWADNHGVFLIADEIAAGMGRLGAPLASHHARNNDQPFIDHGQCLPDFVAISKGLTGGTLPLSCVLIPDAIYDLFLGDYFSGRAFLHSNTYTGNALAIAVGMAALDLLADQNTIDNYTALSAHTYTALTQATAERPWLSNIRHCGLMTAVDVLQPDGSPFPAETRIGYKIFQNAIQRGAWFRPLAHTMYLMPPLTSSIQDIQQACEILIQSIDDTVQTHANK